jgi:NAD(P)-dependent dehydrogenase (short-subunit alcohol dehydrogenase family)
VVTIGGTSGMGLAAAKMLLDGGARVLVTGRSQAGLASAEKELGKGALVVSSDARYSPLIKSAHDLHEHASQQDERAPQ